MMRIETKITGDKEIQRKIIELAKKHPEALRGAINKSVMVVERRAKKEVPVLMGRLRSSITTEVKKEGTGYTGKIGTNVEYAPFVEFGTKPHLAPISAEYARKYGFPVSAGSDYIMLRVSGKAQPFLFPAMKESKGDIIGFLTNAIKGIKT